MPSVVVNPFVELVVDGALFIAIFYVFYRVCSYIFSTLFDPINIAWPASDTKIFGKKRVAGKVPPYYPNGWYKVCDSDTLQKGQTRNFEILGQNLVLFRGENGEASILDAYCPHLGANMGVTGSVKGNCIEVSSIKIFQLIFSVHSTVGSLIKLEIVPTFHIAKVVFQNKLK